MTFNVSQFAAKVNGTGLAKNNLFVVAITSPISINLPIQNDLIFLCSAASIPGMDVSYTEVKPQGWGKTEKRPTDFVKNNLTLTFMIDSNFAVKQYFHRWVQSIVNYNGLNGDISEDPNGKLPYEFDYRDNFIGTIEVVVYSENKDVNGNARTYTYKFNGAYPVSIGSIDTAWENQAEIMLMTVSFAYDTMSVSGMYETSSSMRSTFPALGASSSGGAFGGGLAGGLSGLISQVFNPGGGISRGIQDVINRVTAPLNNALGAINNVRNTARNFVSSLKRLF